ncbi:hypothetical protein N7528_007290 [Penicillium herquei]|nr:hypothetical protein N7528_007290 [Penicillium herquei]
MDLIMPPERPATIIPSMGSFDNLPAEIRFLIWESLFELIRSHSTCKPTVNSLSILRCNSRLHHEISSLLYKDHSIHVAIDARPDYWAILKSHPKIMSISQCCMIQDKATARDRLRNFPFQFFRTQEITVTIQPPLLLEAEHILLGEKINQLVDIIYELPWTPRVRVILNGEWIIEEPSVSPGRRLGQHRITIVKSKLNGKYFYYCDAAILPFTRLKNWQFSIPTNLHEFLSTDRQFRRSFLYRFTRSSHTDISSQALWEEVEAKEIVQCA